jgi:hypothetical protein
MAKDTDVKNPTTTIVGEDKAPVTTLALGEEYAITTIVGESAMPHPEYARVFEKHGEATTVVGEHWQLTDLKAATENTAVATTTIVGEEGGGITTIAGETAGGVVTTTVFGEEGPTTTVVGEENRTTTIVGEGGPFGNF